MEELQSTEALDREILEDARKKAFKILKTADDTAVSSKQSWERKLEADRKSAVSSYAAREEETRKEIMARLPMDKRRIRAEKIQAFLDTAMRDFLKSLDREKMLALLERELVSRLEVSSLTGSCECIYRGLEGGEPERIFKPLAEKFFSGLTVTEKRDPLYAIPGSFPAVVLDFPSQRIIASVDGAASALLLDKRAELAGALLGAGAEETGSPA